jgi:hypothetical protein
MKEEQRVGEMADRGATQRARPSVFERGPRELVPCASIDAYMVAKRNNARYELR